MAAGFRARSTYRSWGSSRAETRAPWPSLPPPCPLRRRLLRRQILAHAKHELAQDVFGGKADRRRHRLRDLVGRRRDGLRFVARHALQRAPARLQVLKQPVALLVAPDDDEGGAALRARQRQIGERRLGALRIQEVEDDAHVDALARRRRKHGDGGVERNAHHLGRAHDPLDNELDQLHRVRNLLDSVCTVRVDTSMSVAGARTRGVAANADRRTRTVKES